ELRRLRAMTEAMIEDEGGDIDVTIGTMIEVPRAALTADEIAGVADFFSFGTNDLTQTTLAFSRDDAERGLLPHRRRWLGQTPPADEHRRRRIHARRSGRLHRGRGDRRAAGDDHDH